MGQLAAGVAKSSMEPYKYVFNNLKYIFTKKPTDAEVKKFGVKLGDILQSVAVPGPGAALTTVLKFAPKLAKLLKKIQKVSCNCFTAGTKVMTDEGEKNIEDIEVGDKVLSKDENNPDGELAYKEVTALFRNQRDDIIKLHVGEQVIETTDNHPFWAEGKGWVFADELQVGDKLQKADGSNLTIDKVEFVKLDEPVTVYNFTVADFHTYYVTDLSIWVHNTNCSVNRVTGLLGKMPEFSGSTRERLLSAVQNGDLRKIVNELYRPGAKVGDGGTASILTKEFYEGSSTHLQKAQDRVKQLNDLAKSGKLGLNDLDILDALRDDLENAIRLFK
jgi:hypothetical protein